MFFALRIATLMIAHAAFAQTAPVVTHLSELPVIKRLEQVRDWKTLDSETAIGQIDQYLKAKGEYQPLDCKFELSDPVRVPYGPGEVRSDVENGLRKQFNGQIVQLVQYEEWKDYPKEAPGFTPAQADNPDWIAFTNLILPELEKACSDNYPVTSLRKIELNGFQTACKDIKSYLKSRFKVMPDNVTCLEPHTFETLHQTVTSVQTENSRSQTTERTESRASRQMAMSFYKLGYPFANGLEYRLIRLIDCDFKAEEVEKEVPLDPLGPKMPEPFAAKTVRAQAEQKPQKVEPRPLTPKEEKEAFKAWEQNQEEERKKREAIDLRLEAESEKRLADEAPRFYGMDEGRTRLAIPSTEMGQRLVETFQKIHQKSPTDQTQLQDDERRLELLKQEVTAKEKELREKQQKSYGKDLIGDYLKTELDPVDPFDQVTVEVDVPLLPDELERLDQVFKEKNPGWMVGCYVRTIARKDRSGNFSSTHTTIECLVPRFQVSYQQLGDEGNGLTIPVPVLGEECKEVKNHCNVTTDTKTRMGIKFSELSLFKSKAKMEPRADSSYYAAHNQKIIRLIEVTAGIQGLVVDAFTKKIIQGAAVKVKGEDQEHAANTDSKGSYVFNPVRLKGLNHQVNGSHHYYHPGSMTFGKLSVFQVNPLKNLELDPKRVTLRGKISESPKPRYGSGLGGIVVQVMGYPQFNAVTNSDGSYEIRNVPAVLTDIKVDDPSGGHQPGKLHFVLDPDKDNENLDVVLTPNLTVVRGRVHISNGRGAPGMRVQIPGHPELSSITDEDGNYEIKDVPYQISGLHVYPAPSGDFDGKSEPVEFIKRFTDNKIDIEVKYNRCDVSGRVVDLVSLSPIAGVRVWLEGAGPRFSTVTKEDGSYEFRKIPLNAVRIRSVHTNKKYFPSKTLTIEPSPAAGRIIEDQDIRLLPREYTNDRIVLVLTWNKKQPDLDSQLYVPGKIRLFYGNHTDAKLSDKIGGYLDVDDTGNGGRETTIIELEKGQSKVPGLYRFMAFQYSDAGLTFQQGGAEIEVYRDGRLWQTLRPPPGKGRLWYALAVDDRQITAKNLIRNYPEFQEYSALSKEYDGFDRKIEKSEKIVTEAKNEVVALSQSLQKANSEVEEMLKYMQIEKKLPPDQLQDAQLADEQQLQMLKRRAAEVQSRFDSAMRNQERKIQDDETLKADFQDRRKAIEKKLQQLSSKINELLNNPI